MPCHEVYDKQDSLKTQCVNQLQSMIGLVQSMKDEAGLQELVSVLGGIHSNMESSTNPQFLHQSSLPTLNGPIQVIIEGSCSSLFDSHSLLSDSIPCIPPDFLSKPNELKAATKVDGSLPSNFLDIRESPSIVEIALNDDELG